MGEGIEWLAEALLALGWEIILIILGAVIIGTAAYWAYEHIANPEYQNIFEEPIDKAYTFVDNELDRLMEKL